MPIANTKTIIVGLSEINAGSKADPRRCPIANALAQAGYQDVYADWTQTTLATEGDEEFATYLHTPALVNWIDQYDHNQPVQPFNLVITDYDLPPCRIFTLEEHQCPTSTTAST